VNARRDAQQTLPAATPEGGCYGSRVFVTNDLIATNKYVVGCGGRGIVSIAGKRYTFLITANWSVPQHDLAPVRVISADTTPPRYQREVCPPWYASQGNVLLPVIGEGDESRRA
jgi:hypothetical protein